MLVSSHLLSEVQHLVDDVVVISQGQLMTTGPIEDLTGASAQVRTPCSGRFADLLTGAGVTIQPAGTDTLVITGLSLDQIGDAAYAAGIPIHELSARADSLEDAFLALTNSASSTNQTSQKGTSS